MADPLAHLTDSTIAPSRAPFAVTPHDVNELPILPKALYVGTGGDVVVRGVDAAADVTYRNVPAGAYLMVRAAFVRATGTTAAHIIGEA